MVIDTSALVAILEQEEDGYLFATAVAAAETCLVSAATVVETGIVIFSRTDVEGGPLPLVDAAE